MRQLISACLLLFLAASCEKNINEDPNTDVPGGFLLRYIEVEENLYGADLHLHGNFGDSTASSKVKIGNTIVDASPFPDAMLLEWKPWYIRVKIDHPNTNTGGGFVSVLNDGKESNKRMVNIWELDMTYHEPDEGTIEKEMRIKGFIRADVDPITGPRFSPVNSSFAAKTTAQWSMGGSGQSSSSGGGVTITLENRNGLVPWTQPYKDSPGLPENFQSELTYKDRSFEISGLRVHKHKATRHSRLAHGSIVPHVMDYSFAADIVPLNELFRLELDANNAIKAGSYVTGPYSSQFGFSWDADKVPAPRFYRTLRWNKMEPRFK